MKIPNEPASRQQFYLELQDQCFRSRHRRITQYNRNQNYYDYGSADTSDLPTLNKIGPHIELLCAYLYSSESTRFTIELGQVAPRSELLKIDAMTGRMQDEWSDSNTDDYFDVGLQWALTWDSVFLKFRWKNGGLVPHLLLPHDFGVFNESVTELGRQEAWCHRFHVSRSQLEWELADHPNKESILKAIAPGTADTTMTQYPQIIRDMVLGSQHPIGIGGAGTGTGVVNREVPAIDDYGPMYPQDMVTLVELWVQDDDLGSEWRVITQTENQGVTIYDREAFDKKITRNLFIPHEVPIVQIRPRPRPGYFWGASEVTRLIPIQNALAQRIEDIRHLLNKQCYPSHLGIGLTIPEDDFRTAMDAENGWISTSDPTGKLENLAPDVPADVFKEVAEYERMFEEASGIPPILRGKGEPGVRSRGQTDRMAQLGSARIKRRAMVIEDSLNQAATLITKMLRHYDDSKMRYVMADSKKEVDFVAAQFTEDFTAKVDSHSNSPVFAEQTDEKAGFMLENHIITRERWVDITRPIQSQQIKEELKVIEKAEQAAAQAEAAKDQPGLRQVK